jgi:hypothetical protein
LRFVRHPELIDVFQAALTAQPSFAESKIFAQAGRLYAELIASATVGRLLSHSFCETFMTFVRITNCGCLEEFPMTLKIIAPFAVIALLLVYMQPSISCVVAFLAKIAA